MKINSKVVTLMENNQSNWETFFRNDTSNMLEDVLPYLPLQYKKAAALFIKLEELRHISQEFHQEETLNACGLNQNETASMETLLSALKLRAPKDTSKKIDDMLQLMKIIKLMPLFMSQSRTSSESEFIHQVNQILKK